MKIYKPAHCYQCLRWYFQLPTYLLWSYHSFFKFRFVAQFFLPVSPFMQFRNWIWFTCRSACKHLTGIVLGSNKFWLVFRGTPILNSNFRLWKFPKRYLRSHCTFKWDENSFFFTNKRVWWWQCRLPNIWIENENEINNNNIRHCGCSQRSITIKNVYNNIRIRTLSYYLICCNSRRFSFQFFHTLWIGYFIRFEIFLLCFFLSTFISFALSTHETQSKYTSGSAACHREIKRMKTNTNTTFRWEENEWKKEFGKNNKRTTNNNSKHTSKWNPKRNERFTQCVSVCASLRSWVLLRMYLCRLDRK